MKVCIESNLKLSVDSSKNIRQDGSIILIGELYGAYYEKCIKSSDESYSWILENHTCHSRLLSFIQHTVGQYYLIIKKDSEIRIINATATPGFYYYKNDGKLYIDININNLISRNKIIELNEYLVYQSVCSDIPHLPFTSLFNNIFNVPGGMECIISKGLHIRQNPYIKKMPKECQHGKKSYNEFKKRLDVTAQLITQAKKDTPINILLSGGIDSVLMLVAFHKAGANMLAYTFKNSRYQNNITYLLTKVLNIPLTYIDQTKIKNMTEDKLYDMYSQYIEPLPLEKNCYYLTSKKDSALFVTGENCDGSYMIHCTGSSVNKGISMYRAYFKYCLKNIIFTNFFLCNLQRFLQNKVFFKFKKMSPFFTFLYGSVFYELKNAQQFPYTLFKKHYGRCDGIEHAHDKNINSLFKHILSVDDLKKIEGSTIKKKDINYFNHLLRIHRYFIYNYNTELQLSSYSSVFKNTFYLAINNNLLHHYFSDFIVSITEAFSPKQYYFQYVNEVLPKSYTYYLKKAAKKSGYTYTHYIIQNIKKTLIRGLAFFPAFYKLIKTIRNKNKNKTKKPNFSSKFLKLNQKLWDQCHSELEFILSHVSTPAIKAYILKVSELRQKKKLNENETSQFINLVNLIVFVKHKRKLKEKHKKC
ncbi:MAG: hypothetical protein VW378_01945 [bacterium]